MVVTKFAPSTTSSHIIQHFKGKFMSSKNIYTPYVYLIGWKHLDTWYYGSRYGKGVHPNDLFVTYFTSSEHVADFISEHGMPDVIEVRKTFDNSISARKWEERVHRKMNVRRSDRWLNKSTANSKFGDTTGKLCVREIQSGRTFQVSVNDPRFHDGTIVPVAKGNRNIAVFDTTNNERKSVTSEEYKKNPNLVSVISGKTKQYDADNNYIGLVNVEDYTPDMANKNSFNRVMVSGIGALSKDEYYNLAKSGDIVHQNKGNTPAKCSITGAHLGRISNNDPRWKTGEIINLHKNRAAAKCAITGESLGNVDKNDPRWETGEIVPLATGTAAARCAFTGVSLGRINLKDPRWETGTIVGARKRFN